MKPELEDEIWGMEELSVLEKSIAAEIMGSLLMSDEEFATSEKNRRALRAFLRSLLKKEKASPVKKSKAMA
jgi:hypothetical protein